jgi:hypothetical protein
LVDYAALDPLEAMRFDFLFGNFLESSMLVARDAELGLADEEDLDSIRANVSRYLTTPGGRAWYKKHGDMVPKAFRRLVEREVDFSEVNTDSE